MNTEERYERANLYKEYDIEIELELIHNKGNEHDIRALEVYHNQLYIGHIRKIFQDDDIDNSKIINDFCFEDNKLRDVSLFWSGEEFYLRRKTKEQREK